MGALSQMTFDFVTDLTAFCRERLFKRLFKQQHASSDKELKLGRIPYDSAELQPFGLHTTAQHWSEDGDVGHRIHSRVIFGKLEKEL